MCNARKYIGLFVITILAITSFVFAESFKIKGDVAGYDANSQTLLVSTAEGFVRLSLAGSVMKRDGTGILPEDFLIGERVVGTYDPTTMYAIHLNAKGGYAEGFITAITSTKEYYEVTVTGPKTKPMTFKITQETILIKNNKEIKGFDYKVGDFAKVFYVPKLMVVLKFVGNDAIVGDADPIGMTVKGFIVKIEISGQLRGLLGRITISTSSGELFSMNVDSRTRITLDGVAADLRALEVGNSVVAEYSPNGYAGSIAAARLKNVDICNGTIVSIKIRGDFVPFIEIVVKTVEYDHPMVFDLPLSAEVWKDGKRAKGFDLKSGDFATILYDELKMDIVKIEAWTATK
jgi:hypothetical protein